MRSSPVCLARKLPKPLKFKVQVFHLDRLAQPPSTLPRIIPRDKVADGTAILSAPAPKSQHFKPPSLLETLLARQKNAPEDWPPNLRIEPVISRQTWEPVKMGIRSKLKRMLRET
ncbi:hypothetical protein MIND_01065400 [Mycena indigotica]|uniref:Uncharacterized protein n=1 Tax=Mycena indigotica TaxID=2126181 RepID=A0A8H6VYU0_9AGAR|nr:uncharacterized protein MIND_01065400 [Mycena indigotica]KAF7295263.1 hypothetical protein MIND_01065400 [Mycena indigotica]